MTAGGPGADARGARLLFVYLGEMSGAVVRCVLSAEGPGFPAAGKTSTGGTFSDRPPLLVAWGLQDEQLEAVRGWLAASGGTGVAAAGTGEALLVDEAPVETLFTEVASAGGIAVVFVGVAYARPADELRVRALHAGVDVRVFPDGTDLHREAVSSDFWRLYELTRKLREECPWDRKQTQESIVAYTVEETYELVDTVRERHREGGDDAVRSELGDLLFQVYFIACVAEEEGLYDVGEVAAGIHRKLVRRHPHIFADVSADTAEDVKRTWDIIKKESEGREGIFHDVPSAFPAALLAQKLQQRAAAVGFDWDEAHEVLAKLKEETAEIEQELASGGGRERVAAEMGDLLFSVVNLARKLKVDPELALRGSALRFRQRVEEAARIAESQGLVFEDLALEEQETYYQHAKEGLER